MKSRIWILTGLALIALAVMLAGPVSSHPAQAQGTLSRVRVLHAVPGAPSVDVYANGTRIASGLAYGKITPHLNVPSGDYQIILRQSGTGADTPALVETTVPLTPDLAYTVVAQGVPGAIETFLYEDILDEIQFGMARLTAISTVADAPALDIVNTAFGVPLLQGINYNFQYGTINIPSGVQNLVVVPAGGAVESALAELGDVSIHAGMLYTIVAMGTLDGGVTTKVLATPINTAADAALVQIAHGSPDAPAVDVYANDTLIATALKLGDITKHLAVPADTYSLVLRETGADTASEPVLSTEITLDGAMPPQTLVVLGQVADASLAIQQFETSGSVTEESALVGVINAVSTASVNVALNDAAATVLASALTSSAQSDAVTITPGEYMLNISIDTGGNPITLMMPAETYYGGMLYSVLVYGSDSTPYNASVQGTAINVGLLSMPAPAQPAVVAAQPTEAVVEPAPTEALPLATEASAVAVATDLPLATQAPVVVPPTAAPEVVIQPTQNTSELVVQPTAAQSELVIQPTQAAEQPPQPVVPQTSPQAIAYVELNPGANLHCRELPGSDKKSLGLIPSGTTLTVIGRTGTPLVPETGSVTPEPTPVVESIEQLWLAVRWEPQGGGYVTCWVNAQSLRVEFRGKLLDELSELWELPEEPFNRPGEIVGADVRPPTPIFDAVIATVQLEPGVSLQLRRYPETAAESLELVPAQAQLEVLGYAEAPSAGLVGQPTDPIWLYVRYRTENGGATIGWVSLQYVTLSKLGRPVNVEDLVVVDVSEAGYYELPGEAPLIPLDQQEVVGIISGINPGGNLNLRDRPSADGLVVVGIPTSDTMVINGRNGDGTWLQVTYSSAAGDLEGWVAAQYLTLTRGGQPYAIIDLPIVNGDAEAMTP